MTQGLEQYHLTHLKISLIYLLNLRYKVLKYKVLLLLSLYGATSEN